MKSITNFVAGIESYMSEWLLGTKGISKGSVYLLEQLCMTNNSLITLTLIKNRRLLCKDV